MGKLGKYYLRVLEHLHGTSVDVNLLHPEWVLRHELKKVFRAHVMLGMGLMLDIGCGTKPYKKDFAEYVTSYVGIDYPAASWMVENPDGVRPEVHGDAMELPIKSGVADSVLLAEVLEHTSDPSKVLAEVSRVMRSDGVLLLSTPFLYPIHGEPFDKFRFTKWGLQGVLRKNGLAPIKILEYGNFWTTGVTILNLYLWSELLGKTSLEKLMKAVLTPVLMILFCFTNSAAWMFGKTRQPSHFCSGFFAVGKKIKRVGE